MKKVENVLLLVIMLLIVFIGYMLGGWEKQDVEIANLNAQVYDLGIIIEEKDYFLDQANDEIDNLNAEIGVLKKSLDNQYVFYDVPILTVGEQMQYQDNCKEYGFDYKWYIAMLWQENDFIMDSVSYNKEGLGSDHAREQLNSRYHDWFAELAGLEDYDITNWEHTSLMGLSYLDWIKESMNVKKDRDAIFVFNVGHKTASMDSDHIRAVEYYYNKLSSLRAN